MEKKKFPGMAIILSIVALSAVVAAVFVIFKFVINDPESPVDTPVDAASITQNANLTNWGFACEIGGEMYYSDHKTGIYISKESGDELYIEGRYSDLCDLGDKLFCVEYFYKQTDDNSSYECLRLVMIDMNTRNSKIVFNTPTDSGTIYLLHRANNRIYFALDEDQLYTVDQNGNVEYTGISHVKKVTSSGIYTNRYPESGFRLVSFDNKELKVFDALDAYNVELSLEVNGYLYLRLTQDGGETVDFIRLDMETGNYTLLPYQKEYGTLRSMNYYDDVIYMTFYKDEKCYICKTALDSDELTLITTLDSPSVWLNLISIADDKLYVAFPYSDAEFITLELN